MAPQAIRALCPRTTPGTPGKETPATSYGQAAPTVRQCSPFMYQIDGIEMPRWGSLASSAPPLTERDGATTQLFEPIPWSEARPAAAVQPGEGQTAFAEGRHGAPGRGLNGSGRCGHVDRRGTRSGGLSPRAPSRKAFVNAAAPTVAPAPPDPGSPEG